MVVVVVLVVVVFAPAATAMLNVHGHRFFSVPGFRAVVIAWLNLIITFEKIFKIFFLPLNYNVREAPRDILFSENW